jgi:hypothetical protein
MRAMLSIKRLLRTAALTAAGLLSDGVLSVADAWYRPAEPENADRAAAIPAPPSATMHIMHRAVRSPTIESERLEALVDQLGDAEPALAAVLLGTALCMAKPLERTPIVCEWATSASLVRRRALARALAHPFMCPGLPTAIEALAEDADAHVRTAAVTAALLRLGHDPQRYGAVLDRSEQRA